MIAQAGWASQRCVITAPESLGYLLTVCVSHAIPAVIAYNYFCAKVEEAAAEISTHVTNFQILYEKGKGKHAGETLRI